MMVALFLAALNQTIVAAPLPAIVRDLHKLSDMPWLVTAYLLAAAIAVAICGRLGELVGHKRLFVVAMAVFLVGSAASGLSRNMVQLIAFRAGQGVGAGGLIISAQAITCSARPSPDSGRPPGLTGAVLAVATAAGPLLGGYLADALSWRWVFYVNVPVGLAVLAGALWLPREPGTAGLDVARTGSLRESLGVSAVVRGLIGLAAGAGLVGVVAYLPAYLQLTGRASAAVAGLLTLPLAAGVLLGVAGSGWIGRAPGRRKLFVIAGTALATMGMALLSRMSPTSTRIENGIAMAALGLGLGLAMRLVAPPRPGGDPPGRPGPAAAVNSLSGQIGGLLGGATVGWLFARRLTAAAAHLPLSAAARLLGGQALTPHAMAQLPAGVRETVTRAYAQALPPAFRYLVPVLAAGFVLSFALRERRPRPAAGPAFPAPPDAPATAGPAATGATAGLAATAATAGPAAPATSAGWETAQESPPAKAAPESDRPQEWPAVTVPEQARGGGGGGVTGRAATTPPVTGPQVTVTGPQITGPGVGGPGVGGPPVAGPGVAGPAGEPPVPQEGTPRLRGHVRQADGAPVKGATLTLIDVAGQQAGRDRTRPDGSYDVPLAAPGAFTLIVTAGGREPEVCAVHVGAGPTDWDVTLAGSGCLTGTVRVTGPGTRVAGAAVTLLGPHGDVVAAGCTDDAGRYRLDAVAPGRYTLVLSATSCQPAALPILVAADTVTTQDAELARQARLEGTARAADGAGVPDARIALLDREGNTVAVTTTGPDGSYAFDGLPNGDYTVIASGYPPAASSLRVGPCQPNFHDVRLSHPQD